MYKPRPAYPLSSQIKKKCPKHLLNLLLWIVSIQSFRIPQSRLTWNVRSLIILLENEKLKITKFLSKVRMDSGKKVLEVLGANLELLLVTLSNW